MNKYKLVPYLVLSKEDAQLEKMQEELSTILNDKSIDDVTKLALYEDLLSKINRFKESYTKHTTAQLQIPPHHEQTTTSVQTESMEEGRRDEDTGDRRRDIEKMDDEGDAEDEWEDDEERHNDSSTIPYRMGSEAEDERPFLEASFSNRKRRRSALKTPSPNVQNQPQQNTQMEIRKKKEAQPRATQTISPRNTRSGTTYYDTTRLPNRPIGRTNQWDRDPWKK